MATPDQDVRNRKLNPEARMELKEHLREFRDRFIKAAIATIIAAIIGTVFLYQPFIEMISATLQQINAETGRNANLNYGSVASPFDQLLKVGMYIGMVIASPVWLYQALRFPLRWWSRTSQSQAAGRQERPALPWSCRHSDRRTCL